MVNFASGTTGALSGAATGATIGSAVPVIGTAIGAGVGGVAGGLAGLFGGGRKKKKRLSTFDKRQRRLNEQQYQSLIGEGPLADLYNYDPEAANQVFDKTIANPAYRDLQEKAIPGVTGQFRSKGLMNSSYAGDAVAKLTRDVQEGLDAQRTKYLYGEQQDARNARRGAVENLQNRSTFAYTPSKGFDINSILGSFSPEETNQLANYFKGNKNAPTKGGENATTSGV